jgi:hypothetical protein
MLIVAQAVTLPKTATRVERMTRKLLDEGWAPRSTPDARRFGETGTLGQIKQARGFRQFLLRGVAKVQGEWADVCTHAPTSSKLYRL